MKNQVITKIIIRMVVLLSVVFFVSSCSNPAIIYQDNNSKSTETVSASNGLSQTFVEKYYVEGYNGPHLSSFSFAIKPTEMNNIILEIESSYYGKQPELSYRHNLYFSPHYFLAFENEFGNQSWRIPKSLDGSDILVSLEIPSETVLIIRSIKFFYERARYSIKKNLIRFDSHLGFTQMCPENTISSVKMAGELGYDSCIVVPKVTKDGVIVCMHDDTITRTGKCLGGEKAIDRVEELTYEELLEYDFGSYKHPFWSGEKIMKMVDFFSICAEYKMRPIFSTHPNLTNEKWKEVREMLFDFGLLSTFTIKSFNLGILISAFSVFGNDIKGYTGDEFDVKTMDKFISTTGLDKNKLEIIIERHASADKSIIKNIIDSGYKAFIYTISSSYKEKDIRDFIEIGVSGFTDDSFCQNGMGIF